MENKDKVLAISDTLKDLGIAASLSGYHYLRCAVALIWEGNKMLPMMSLYKDIAKKFNKTCSSVERACRHAIESGWSRGNIDTQNKLFGYSTNAGKGNPTNSEFIMTVADYLLMIQEE